MSNHRILSESLLLESLQLRVVHGELTQHEYLVELHESYLAGKLSEAAWNQGLHYVTLPLTKRRDEKQVDSSAEHFVTGWSNG